LEARKLVMQIRASLEPFDYEPEPVEDVPVNRVKRN